MPPVKGLLLATRESSSAMAAENLGEGRGGREGWSSEACVEGSSEFIRAAILVSSEGVGAGSMSAGGFYLLARWEEWKEERDSYKGESRGRQLLVTLWWGERNQSIRIVVTALCNGGWVKFDVLASHESNDRISRIRLV